MIEIIILNFLKTQLSVPVYLERPDTPPPQYVYFEKTGGSRSNGLISSTFAFQSYADSLYDASVLNETVKNAVDNLITLGSISGLRLNSDYKFTDVVTKKHRYQAVYDIYHY